MEEYVYQIRRYLPVEFSEDETNEFIDYLLSAYLDNIRTEKYQFSFTAFHMLYMSYIYKVKWFLKGQGNEAIDKSLNDYVVQNKGSVFNTLYDLSQIQEKTTIEKLLKSLSFHVNDIDLCKNLVEVRNKCSHASGKVYFKRSAQIENYIQEEIESIQAIQSKVKSQLNKLFDEFINQNHKNTWIESDLKDWIVENYLSEEDIITILNYKPTFLRLLSDNTEIILKKFLYCNVIFELQKYTDGKVNVFLKSLQILSNGLIENIDMRKNSSDDEKLKSTQELLEERILPLLTELSNEDAKKAQQFLDFSSVS